MNGPVLLERHPKWISECWILLIPFSYLRCKTKPTAKQLLLLSLLIKNISSLVRECIHLLTRYYLDYHICRIVCELLQETVPINNCILVSDRVLLFASSVDVDVHPVDGNLEEFLIKLYVVLCICLVVFMKKMLIIEQTNMDDGAVKEFTAKI